MFRACVEPNLGTPDLIRPGEQPGARDQKDGARKLRTPTAFGLSPCLKAREESPPEWDVHKRVPSQNIHSPLAWHLNTGLPRWLLAVLLGCVSRLILCRRGRRWKGLLSQPHPAHPFRDRPTTLHPLQGRCSVF